MAFNPSWILLRVWKNPAKEAEIVERFGWPTRSALNALVEYYRPQTLECVRFATSRWLSARITTDDLQQAVFLFLLEKGMEWDPSRAAFADQINLWGSRAISDHCARYRYPVRQGRQVLRQKKKLEFTSADWDLQTEDLEPDPILRRAIASFSERCLTPIQARFLEGMVSEENIAEVSRGFGLSRARGHQIRDRIAVLMEKEGLRP